MNHMHQCGYYKTNMHPKIRSPRPMFNVCRKIETIFENMQTCKLRQQYFIDEYGTTDYNNDATFDRQVATESADR